jgi:hypothetical protein
MVYDQAEKAVLLFGSGGSGQASTWLYHDGSWLKQHPAVSPPPLSDAALAYDSHLDEAVLFGGSVEGKATAQTWIYRSG